MTMRKPRRIKTEREKARDRAIAQELKLARAQFPHLKPIDALWAYRLPQVIEAIKRVTNPEPRPKYLH